MLARQKTSKWYINFMTRIIARTLVSSKQELPFVLMNIEELVSIVDEFYICEADITHTGDLVENSLKEFYEGHIANNKVHFLRMNLRARRRPWNSDSGNLHYNEQIIRNGFAEIVQLEAFDIVISMDGDEVIFENRAKKIIRRLNRRIMPRESYVLRLNQIIYRLSYKWVDCDFRGPVIARAKHFLSQDNPQWRYSGFPTLIKSGTHFSWLMTPSEMVTKILKYSHRQENEKYANVSLLEESINERKYIFEENRSFKIVISKTFSSKYYPKSLRKYLGEFPEILK